MKVNSVKKAAEILGVSERTIYRLISAGEFPRPIQLSPRRVGWTDEQLEAHISKLLQAAA